MDSNYDVVLIGSGTGGYVAAIRAAQLGLKTAVIEKEALGGVCLNWGCIPSKALLKNAEVVSYFNRADEFGLKMDNFSADFSVAMDRSRKVVDRNTKGVAFLLDKNKVDHIQGSGKVVGVGKVEVSPDGNVIESNNIVISTGARPRSIAPLPIDGEKIITSRESITLSDLPKSIIIVGGGAIGVELAYIYRMNGEDVTIVEMLPRLVPNEDEDISAQLERSFKRENINVMTGAGVIGSDTSGSGVKVTVDKDGTQEVLECDKVLVAIGVQPNVEDLGLETVGIASDRSGIIVDDRMATNVPGIYAIGDVNGKMPLAHVASAQALVAVEDIAGLETQALDYAYMPRATYCHPQIASFGLTETQAREQGKDINVGTFNVQANGKAAALGENSGLVKLVVDAKYGEILGGHMIGPEVTELLGELSMTRILEGTVLELGWAVHSHPSLSEMLKEAALGAQGRTIHM